MVSKQTTADNVETCNSTYTLSPAEIRSGIKSDQPAGSNHMNQSNQPAGSMISFAKKLGGNSNDCTMGESNTCQRPDNLEIY
jgi:hypothetical protein